MSHLEGKNYIVTGASRGIGLAAAKLMAKRGAKVTLFGRDEAALKQGAAEAGNGARGVSVDLTSREALIEAVNDAAAAMGGLDGIVNNAGMTLFAKVENLVEADVMRQVQTNFLAQAYGAQAAIPHLRKRGGGRILNVSSVSVHNYDEFPFISIYVATKAAVERFTLELRQEVKFDNIGVTLFVPGSTYTTFGAGQDEALMAEAFQEWLRRGSVYDGSLTAENAGEALVNCLELPDGVNYDFVQFSPNRPTTRQSSMDNYEARSDHP